MCHIFFFFFRSREGEAANKRRGVLNNGVWAYFKTLILTKPELGLIRVEIFIEKGRKGI